MDELIRKLIELVENASPKLWEIAMRQVLVYNILNALFLVFVVGLIFVSAKWWFPKLREVAQDDSDFDALAVMGIMGLSITLVILTVLTAFEIVPSLVTGLFNPQYAAIYNLLQLVK